MSAFLDAEIEIVLSFDVEEHHQIEAAAGLEVGEDDRAHYRERLAPPTRWILEMLERRGVKATFFIVGKVAESRPEIVREIHSAGHEVACHSWAHHRIHSLTPESFREDLRKNREILEDITGEPALGYRAPTFSIVRRTSWAIDVLAESGMLYDSSIYPVRHDRYGVPEAPRAPFMVRGSKGSLLEFPPASLRVLGTNVPTGGGGYFRLFPLSVMERTIRQTSRICRPAVAMLYFHPWEFDPEQRRLPLSRISRFRTYVGLRRSRDRLETLISRHRFVRAIDVAKRLDSCRDDLPRFDFDLDPTTERAIG